MKLEGKPIQKIEDELKKLSDIEFEQKKFHLRMDCEYYEDQIKENNEYLKFLESKESKDEAVQCLKELNEEYNGNLNSCYKLHQLMEEMRPEKNNVKLF